MKNIDLTLVTDSTQPVLYHGPRVDLTPPNRDHEARLCLWNYLERTFGCSEGAFRESNPTDSIEVVHVRPGRYPFHVLATLGMSERAMWLEDERVFAELALALPPQWELDPRIVHDPSLGWPVGALMSLAEIPRLYRALLWDGHVVTNGDPASPIAEGTEFCGSLIQSPGSDCPLVPVKIRKDMTVHFLTVVPLLEDEVAFHRGPHSSELKERLCDGGVGWVLDSTRLSVCSDP